MTRLTSDLSAGDTGRIEQYNNLRIETKASAYLFAFAQSTPDLTLKVSPGQIYFGTTLVEYAGGNSPSFTAPTTHPRIDILSINNSGALVRTAGDEGATPTAPDVPVGETPIAQVYNRVGQTSIKDADDSTNGYIQKDLRPFLSYTPTDIQTFTGDGTWTKPDGAKSVLIEIWGAGASGGAYAGGTSFDGAGGGGGGEYKRAIIPASGLGATEAVVVGDGGSSVTSTGSRVGGNAGGNSSFGGLTAVGGKVGSSQTGGAGGSQYGVTNGLWGGSNGENAMYSAGGGNAISGDKRTGGDSIYGGGGGGAGYHDQNQSGGESTFGGNGGTGRGSFQSNATGNAGSAPGGGGGGAHAYGTGGNEAISGAGGDGRVRITTYF